MNSQNLSALIWSVADLLRGDYRQSDYGKVILPFTTLRRLNCVLTHTLSAQAKAFYERYGFNASSTQPMTLILSPNRRDRDEYA